MGGPGETQIETDRRLIGRRISRLKRELKEVKRTRHLHRQARQKVPYPVIALVGYHKRREIDPVQPSDKSGRSRSGISFSRLWTRPCGG